jgi:hypothetical protein
LESGKLATVVRTLSQFNQAALGKEYLMEKIELQPGVWTRLLARRLFQVVGQNSIRISLGYASHTDAAGTVRFPPADDAPYFTTQGYDPKISTLLAECFGVSDEVYLMPDGDSAVTVVAL